ncbi:hypothetical protein BSU04_35125 [Caballeronia sordidicola]|uniref:Uncharacterized protein n=1 Tax=Caballeronia sordidicola TaxID=196367 RepID=A0A226WRI3_CABSO|nr:hypothetical protein BSU04_35125 [Caballeronia sordidicola]
MTSICFHSQWTTSTQAEHGRRGYAVAHALLHLASWAMHPAPRNWMTDAQSLAA